MHLLLFYKILSTRNLFALLLFSLFAATASAQVVNGRVIDGETGEPLPGVAVEYNQTLRMGEVTDIDGYFAISNLREVQQVVCSFIGYTTATFNRGELPRDGGLWVIKLFPESEQLNEVEVIAGENPALRIVRLAIDHRLSNNPQKYPSYEYVSYNKNILTYRMDLPDSLKSRKDSLRFVKDTTLAKSRHILVLESVTKKKFKAPYKGREEVVATKISGFDNPAMGVTPEGQENFGFHENIINHLSKEFINPIAKGADKKYVYILTDTTFLGTDTIYHMDYFPEKGANFDAFKGELSIHTRNWAMVHIIAYPADMGPINLYIEQEYSWVQNAYWFPKKMHLEIELDKIPLRNTGAVMVANSTFDSVIIGKDYPDELFSHIEVKLNDDAGKAEDDFWEKYRTEPLDAKELTTYKKMDSIGQRYKFDALLKSTRNVYDGFIALDYVDIEYSKLLAFNQYEGFRLGAGLYTNEDVSKKFRLGGYFGYGFRDEAYKYGGKFIWYFNKPRDFYFTAMHLKDVRDPGGVRLKYSEWKSVAEQFFNVLMDKVKETNISLTFRPTTYVKLTLGMRQFSLLPTYNYQFLGTNPDGQIVTGAYNYSEVNAMLRWQHKEKFSTNWGQRISYGSDYPVFSANYSHGFAGPLNAQFEYNKFEVGIFYKRYTKGFGKTRIQLEAGYVDRPVPWSMNFSGRPSYNPSFSVVVRETFQTMRFNEFSSTQYAALFFMHDFGPLLLRTRIFKPEFRIFQGATFGTLRYADMHQGVNFKGLDHGYYESGVVVDNIIRISMISTGYLGIGAGAFYRYGPYHLDHEPDNWTFKIAFMYSIN